MLSEEPISAVHPLPTGINKLSAAAYLWHLYVQATHFTEVVKRCFTNILVSLRNDDSI